MTSPKIIPLPLSEHAILFLLPVLLIAIQTGLLRFKGMYMHPEITTPVSHVYNGRCLSDAKPAIVYADPDGTVFIDCPFPGLIPPPSFRLPAAYFSLHDDAANKLRVRWLNTWIHTPISPDLKIFLCIAADKNLPYSFMKQLWSAIGTTQQHYGWCRTYWIVTEQ